MTSIKQLAKVLHDRYCSDPAFYDRALNHLDAAIQSAICAYIVNPLTSKEIYVEVLAYNCPLYFLENFFVRKYKSIGITIGSLEHFPRFTISFDNPEHLLAELDILIDEALSDSQEKPVERLIKI